MHMFFLISLVVSKNYCVGNGRDPCYEICKDFNVTFDYIYPEIPRNYLFEDDSIEIHKIYIAKNTSYYESNHTIIFCDPSIYLEYRRFESLTITKDNIIIDSEKKLRNYPMIFYPGSTNTIDINVQADGNGSVIPFILDTDDATRTLNVYFYYDNTPENLISISDSSNMIIINHINDKVTKLFTNSDKLSVLNLTYYCISDKETKCEGFDNYSLQYINSTEEITDYPLILIVDSSIPQILINIKSFTHVIGLPGSDITFYNDFNSLFINSDSIEATNFYFEGQGNLTIAFLSNFSIILTTQTNNFNLTFKNTEFHQLDKSHIYSFNENIDFEFENKIRISDYSLFKGPKRLSGLFEKGKYLSEDEFVFYNVTVENLKEYDYKYVTYYFKEGDHEIPKTWKNRCRFQGIYPNKTNFIFSDVYSYNGQLIDGFIDVNIFPSSQYNMITIKPAKIFQLDSFKDIVYNYEYAEKYTILVDHDFIMNGTIKSKAFDMDEMSHDQCKIVGEGTISFLDERFMNYTRELCTIDDTVHLKLLDTKLPNYYVCVGQENAEKCKAEIALSDSIRDSECFWIRNLATRLYIYNYQELFITDKRDVLYGHLFPRSVLTANSCVTVEFYRLEFFYTYKDGFNEVVIAQNRSAKLIILFNPEYSSYKDYVHKDVLEILCHGLPTEINMWFYLNYESIQLNIMWIENYTQNTIHFGGKARIYIRKHIESMIDFFERPDSVVFSINYDHSYDSIIVSDKPIQYWGYTNYVLCKNSEELMEYDHFGNPDFICLYKNISLFFDSHKYRCEKFIIGMSDHTDTQFINIELPNDCTIIFTGPGFTIAENKYRCYIISISNGGNFIFNIKEKINLNLANLNDYDITIEFNTSCDSIEIFPSQTMAKLIGRCIIKVDDNVSIFSPAPLYIDGLFGSHPVNYSKDWIYYHSSEEGKALYGSHPSIPFDSFENDENLPEKFVLAVGDEDNLTIPTNLKKSHDIFIYQNSYFRINEPLNITYYNDGIVFNEKVKIICGRLDIIAMPVFEINSEIDCYERLLYFFYFAMINLTLNPHTDVNVGVIKNLYVPGISEYLYRFTSRVVNNLTFYVDTDYEYRCISYMKHLTNLTCKYHVAYDYICYIRYSYGIASKCPGYVLHSSDITSLLTSIAEYPKLDVLVAQDMILPYPTGNHFVLMPYDESIMFDLPSAPYLMTISNEKTVHFNYSDSTYIEILNKSIINLRLMDDLKLLVDSNSDSTFTFTLESDAFISAELNDKNANFSISVVNNSYHLYTDDLSQFGNINIDSLELYYRICACDSNKSSYCNFPKSDTFENIFNENYYFNAAEIVLTSNSKEIKLPSISYPTFVNILPISMAKLTLSPVSDLEVNNESVIINEFWNFKGDLKVLTLKLDIVSSLSVDEQISVPITFQLTGEQSYIDLRDFDEQVSPKITILKHVNDNSSNINNLITVFGKNESYYNFINNIVNHDGISILLNDSSKYLCICKDDKSCNECKEGVDGLIDSSYSIRSDPGENVKIRVFSDIEISSKIFTNDHDVYINNGCNLNLTYASFVNQNINDGLKVDNLLFVNGSNLLLKPKDVALDIEMRKGEKGHYFSIEIDTFLRLNVTNADDTSIESSRLYVNGFGELNSCDYPFDRIRPASTVKVIRGVYVICNSNNGNGYCSYKSIHVYRQLGTSNVFRSDFDPNSKIIVFLDTFPDNIDANLNDLQNQKIEFMKNETSKSATLLESKNKVRFLSTTELTRKADSTTELGCSKGGALLDNSDSDLFIVGVDDILTIKQEGNVSDDVSAITIQPINDKMTLVIDDSFDIEKQKLKIETDNENPVSVTIHTNKNISSEEILNNFIETDETKVSVNFGDEPSKEKKKGFPMAAIIGIVVGAVVLIVVIILIVIFVIRKRKNNSRSEDVNDEHDELDDQGDYWNKYLNINMKKMGVNQN